jgi:hypothetical protein
MNWVLFRNKNRSHVLLSSSIIFSPPSNYPAWKAHVEASVFSLLDPKEKGCKLTTLKKLQMDQELNA